MELKFYTRDYEVMKVFDAWSLELFIATRSETRTNNKKEIIYEVSPRSLEDLFSNIGNQLCELNKLYVNSYGKSNKSRNSFTELKERLKNIYEEGEDLKPRDEFAAMLMVMDKYDILLDLAQNEKLMMKVLTGPNK